MNVQQSDLIDPALVAEVDLARAAAQEEAGDERVGDYVEYQIEDSAAVTHLFEADKPGYRGWRWAVTITSAGPASDVTVSEVVLLPGPTALVAPEWVPWQQRVQAGDLGVGDLLPTSPDDPRLVPAYVASDDPAVEEVAVEAGLGRVRVMSRPARVDAADRWVAGDFGPRSDMARSAPAQCGTCGFYLPLAGSLRAAFGTCGNEFSPADGHVVHVEYGCGAHSEAEVEQVSPVLVADLIYDDAQLDVEPLAVVDEVPVESAGDAASSDSASESAGDAGAGGEVPVEGASESASPVEVAGAAVGEASADSVPSGVAVESAGLAGVSAPDGSVASGVAGFGGEASVEGASGGSDVAAESAESVSPVEADGSAAVSGDEASDVAVESAGSVGVSAPDGSVASGVAGFGGEAPVEGASGGADVAASQSAESESPVEVDGPAAVSGDEASDAAVESAGPAGVSAPDGSVASDVAGFGGEAPVEEASGESDVESVESAGPAVREPVGSGIAGSSGDPSVEAEPAVESAGSESPDSGEASDSGVTASAGAEGESASPGVGELTGGEAFRPEAEAPVALSPGVEDAAPAAIEPVVTGETSPGDESASRE